MFSKQDRGLELLRPGDTRFGTHFIMLERMLKVRPALQQMAFSTDWEDWQCGSSVKKTTVTEILTSCDFWKAIALVVKGNKSHICIATSFRFRKAYHGQVLC